MRFSHYRFIDPPVLLRAAGDDLEAFRSLSQTFLQIAPPMLERLQQALAGGERKAIIHASHSLRGTTVLVGAVALSEVLRALEAAPLEGQVQPSAQALAQMLQDVVAEVEFSISHSHNGFESVHGARQKD